MNAQQVAQLFIMERGRGGENTKEDIVALAKLLNDWRESQRITRWGQLIADFQKLREHTGNDKATSYEVKIWVDLYEGWNLNLGTYDIADWQRHTNLGPYSTEEEALVEFERIIERAKKAIENMGV